MERISIRKNSHMIPILFEGLKSKEFVLVKRTYSENPKYVFFNSALSSIAIYNCMRHNDELIFITNGTVDKLKSIINDLSRFGGDEFKEISNAIEKIFEQGSPLHPEVIYISQF
jgi:hypothetical protein